MAFLGDIDVIENQNETYIYVFRVMGYKKKKSAFPPPSLSWKRAARRSAD